MFKCKDCRAIFDEPAECADEVRGDLYGIYTTYYDGCPYCGSVYYKIVIETIFDERMINHRGKQSFK